MNKEEILLKLKDVKPLLAEKYGVRSLALFGSYSRNEQTESSDIDLFIDLSQNKAAQFFDCAFILQDLFQNKKVEVVTKEALKPQYYEAIKQDLIYA